jgi:two-component system CheB/CheR fusion protein
MLLANEGHQVETCLDGVSGLSAVAIFRPDVVLLDIGLPGMGGYRGFRGCRTRHEWPNALLSATSVVSHVTMRQFSLRKANLREIRDVQES